ncbi:cupin domain-containing protein [Bordetella sp. BOR01]|uniref:cupin domain-containing protein n=1 Tax=Bordetella sp. BOR01 TaxID=2854779 RepID=UPI001C492AA0|nr:cupin domain-containing protein [Bordetella sp. BOR01]MBV7484768.1 cupin domain-containing protein [Bordetella sp. BOR01]
MNDNGKAETKTGASSLPYAPAVTRNLAELLWTEYPGHHHQALSKAIVTPDLNGSKFFDHRISCYEPGAYVESHVHKVQEQIYHVLSGEGVLITDGERRVVRGNDVAFIPPGVVHELHCTGTDTLVFLVITTPPTDE